MGSLLLKAAVRRQLGDLSLAHRLWATLRLAGRSPLVEATQAYLSALKSREPSNLERINEVGGPSMGAEALVFPMHQRARSAPACMCMPAEVRAHGRCPARRYARPRGLSPLAAFKLVLACRHPGSAFGCFSCSRSLAAVARCMTAMRGCERGLGVAGRGPVGEQLEGAQGQP